MNALNALNTLFMQVQKQSKSRKRAGKVQTKHAETDFIESKLSQQTMIRTLPQPCYVSNIILQANASHAYRIFNVCIGLSIKSLEAELRNFQFETSNNQASGKQCYTWVSKATVYRKALNCNAKEFTKFIECL